MASLLLSFLTPPPVNLSPDYEGTEYRWKFITIRPAFFQNEPYFIAGILLFIALYFWGKRVNQSRVNKWFDTHTPLLEAQFSMPIPANGLVRDGNSDWFNFSTGRRAVKSLHTTFALRPRHDLLQYIYQFGRGLMELDYKAADAVELDFTFNAPASASAVPDCVWAVIAKDEMKGIRTRRWDFTFTKTTDNPTLPPSLTVMSEFADITTSLLKPLGALDLPAVLSAPATLKYFRSLSITDQPRTRPSAPLPQSQRSKHLILELTLPPPSDAAATLPLLQAAFQLVDAIAGEGKASGMRGGLAAQLRPETKNKLKKTREEVEKQIREEAKREQREEEEEKRATAKRKAEEERLSRLSAADQKKALDREKKRAMRKSQTRMKVR
ncbi:DUF1682-domain-containing protein [Rhodofomes roseus]|uniref:DUF1682-domain-containing protein n=1 Tax=Rhodofomes roseus TaxID=34475 RepID=A0ABQ8KZ80_9APHY|nr:DUF1682-domain-containing protein [Rhodofomes roseus]KAH9844318.1 DUF1682-domain-containing protein [Rhodofomes roseus]